MRSAQKSGRSGGARSRNGVIRSRAPLRPPANNRQTASLQNSLAALRSRLRPHFSPTGYGADKAFVAELARVPTTPCNALNSGDLQLRAVGNASYGRGFDSLSTTTSVKA